MNWVAEMIRGAIDGAYAQPIRHDRHKLNAPENRNAGTSEARHSLVLLSLVGPH